MYSDYSAEGAETGHTPAQAPHSTQASASITYLPSPAEIAFTGHSLSHVPQLMQSSEIIYAIKNTSIVLAGILSSSIILYHTFRKNQVFLKKYCAVRMRIIWKNVMIFPCFWRSRSEQVWLSVRMKLRRTPRILKKRRYCCNLSGR